MASRAGPSRKRNITDINEILETVLGDDSGDDIDLGESDDDFSADSDWEYEAEVFNAPIPAVEVQTHPAAPLTEQSPSSSSSSPPPFQPIIDENPILEIYMVSANESETEDLQVEQANNSSRSPSPSLTPPPPAKRGRGRARARGGEGRGVRGRGVRVRGGRGRAANPRGNGSDNWKWGKIEEVAQADDAIQEETEPLFVENEGLRVRIKDNASVLDYLELYLTDDIVNHIVTETNRFANQFFESNQDKFEDSYSGKWSETNILEMKKFFGLLVLMGIIHKPNIPMYWSTDSLYYTPIFSKVMTRDRFTLLQKFLHFNDNNDVNYDPDSPERDRLHKVRPFIEMITERCRKVYYPGKNLSVDESLVLFKGRLHFKQYIKTKRARFGIKLYELTTSDGITLDLLVYCGKGMFHNDDVNSDMPTTERIPAVLMRPYLNKGHILFTDNFYTSPSLATYLLENGTHLCGTVRTNRRHYSKDIANEDLTKGSASFYQADHDNRIKACKYRSIKDKAGNVPKVVYMLSTCHNATMEDTGKEDREGNPVLKPGIVKSYNSHMGGVDRVDQQLHNIQSLRKSYKWYKKLALRLVMQVTLNAHKVFQHHTGSNKNYHNFLHDAIVLLLTYTPTPERALVNNRDDTYERLSGRHFPSVKKTDNNSRPHKKCRVCSARGIKTAKGQPLKTVYLCTYCPSQPGLHPDTCFEAYHTLQDYSNMPE